MRIKYLKEIDITIHPAIEHEIGSGKFTGASELLHKITTALSSICPDRKCEITLRYVGDSDIHFFCNELTAKTLSESNKMLSKQVSNTNSSSKKDSQKLLSRLEIKIDFETELSREESDKILNKAIEDFKLAIAPLSPVYPFNTEIMYGDKTNRRECMYVPIGKESDLAKGGLLKPGQTIIGHPPCVVNINLPKGVPITRDLITEIKQTFNENIPIGEVPDYLYEEARLHDLIKEIKEYIKSEEFKKGDPLIVIRALSALTGEAWYRLERFEQLTGIKGVLR
jgi:predicted house-cleaning noncanonical NTP pyrophosphatase (MazG superfamily)